MNQLKRCDICWTKWGVVVTKQHSHSTKSTVTRWRSLKTVWGYKLRVLFNRPYKDGVTIDEFRKRYLPEHNDELPESNEKSDEYVRVGTWLLPEGYGANYDHFTGTIMDTNPGSCMALYAKIEDLLGTRYEYYIHGTGA